MNRVGVIAASALVGLAVIGCTRDDDSIKEKLESIDKRLEGIERAIARGGGAGGARRGQRQRKGPDPRAVYAIPLGDSAWEGTKDAKVTVVEAFEFAWPYCQKVSSTVKQLLSDYDGDIKVVFKNFVVHPQVATAPARAACAAHKQGKFKEMYEAIWAKGFAAYRAERDPSKLNAENMEAIASSIGLDMSKYKSDLQGCARDISRDESEMRKFGISGTPGFFINGRYLRGAQPLPRFKALIDEELKKANGRIQKGEASAANYYEKFVLGKGKKSL